MIRKKLLFFTFLVIFLSGFCNVCGYSIDLPGAGKIVGSTMKTAWTKRLIFQFQDITYAESPSGYRRFRKPAPAHIWAGVKDGRHPGRDCPSKWTLESDAPINRDIEDCLHLSIYSNNVHERRPVIVFLYSYYFSEGSTQDFAPDYLLEEDIVLVVPQFRLGPLGFLTTRSEDLPGNYAVYDVIFALEWIQKYISYFGGDPESVTLAGHTGGAAIAHLLTLSNKVPSGLFHQVILISGSLFAPWAIDVEPLENSFYVDEPRLCAQNSAPNSCFRSINATDLIKNYYYKKERRRNIKLYDYELGLVIDGRGGILEHEPIELGFHALNDTKRHSYPTLLGVTKHGGTDILFDAYKLLKLTLSFMDKMTSAAYIKTYLIPIVLNMLGLSEENGLLSNIIERDFFKAELLETGNLEKCLDSLIDLFTTIHVKSPVLQAAKFASQINEKSTFLYTFDYLGQYSTFLDKNKFEYSPFNGGVTIRDDLQYLFPRKDGKKLNEDDIEIAKFMIQMWGSFARNGIPSVPGIVQPVPMVNLTGPYFHVDRSPSIGITFTDEFFVTSKDAKNGISLRKSAKKLF